jgi:hypothetical protein
MSNFFDLKCPKCGDENQIDIQASVWLRLTSNGTDPDASGNGDHHFTPASPAECCNCGHVGTMKDFETA